jgi:ketosteroid isomerase-like protein
MRRFAVLPILLLAVVLTLAGCAGGQKPPAVDPAAITAVIDSISKATNAAIAAKDTDAVVGRYAEDAHLLAPNMPRVDGREAIRKGWVTMLSAPGAQLALTSGQKIVSQAGDLVVDLGTYDYRGLDPKQKPVQEVGKYVTVYKQVDGQWKMVVDAWNSDPAPAKPGK